jgi:acetyl esterase/lipase
VKVAENAASLNANPELGFLVYGTLAGANLAAVLSLLVRDEQLLPPLTGAFIADPITFDYRSVPENFESHWLSFEQNKSAPVFNMAAYKFFMGKTVLLTLLRLRG